MRGTPITTIINRYWKLVMWNRTEDMFDYMAYKVVERRDRKGVKYGPGWVIIEEATNSSDPFWDWWNGRR